MSTDVRVYYLELAAPEHLRVGKPTPLTVVRVDPPDPDVNKRFYEDIGLDWHWVDRKPWPAARWREFVVRPGFETWIGMVDDAEAGYFELERVGPGEVEIAMFGLLAGFRGRGLGGALLEQAVRRAWDMEASRVLVNTCSLDHPGALHNYRARGFRVYEERTRSAPPGER